MTHMSYVTPSGLATELSLDNSLVYYHSGWTRADRIRHERLDESGTSLRRLWDESGTKPGQIMLDFATAYDLCVLGSRQEETHDG